MKIARLISLLGCLCCCSALRSAASDPIYPGSIDLRFNPGFPLQKFGSGPRIMLTAPDDSMILLGRSPEGKIVKINPDGTSDDIFYSHSPESIRFAAFDSVGRLLAVRDGVSESGYSTPTILRLDSDGAWGTLPAFVEQSYITTIAPTAQRDILVGGFFPGGLVLLRLADSGVINPSFNVTGSASVERIAVQGDGRIIVTGQFTSINGVPRNHIARLNKDGALDVSYNPGASMFATQTLTFNSILLDSMDRLYIVGNFSVVGGQARDRFARLEKSGELDPAFPPPSASTSVINSLSLDREGNILVAGYPSYRLANDVVDRIFPWSCDSFQQRRDGKYYVSLYNGDWNSFAALFNADGTRVETFNTYGPNRAVRRVKVLTTGQVAIAGDFSPTLGFPREQLAILNPDGTVDMKFDPSVKGAFDLDTSIENRIYYITRALNPSFGFFDYPAGTHSELTFDEQSSLRSLLVLRSGKILVSGVFSPPLATGKYTVRFNSDLTLDTTWKGGWSPAATMVEAPNGDIYAGSSSVVVKLRSDGSLDKSFIAPPLQIQPSTPFSAEVRGLALDSENRLLVSGLFNYAGTNATDGILRLNSDGSLEQTFRIPNYSSDGTYDVLVRPGGGFVVAAHHGIYAFEDGNWHTVLIGGPKVSNQSSPDANIVYSLARTPSLAIYAAGDFTAVNDIRISNIVRLWADNVPLQISLNLINQSATLAVIGSPGQPGETISIESSSDLKTWAPDKIVTNFSGAFTESIGITNSHKFLRAIVH